MKPGNSRAKDIPLNIVGSSVFGRYPKISPEQTYNMIISDGWLVPYAGYKKAVNILDEGQGRGAYTSDRYGKMIVVVNEKVYAISPDLSSVIIGTLDTSVGDVFIDENNNNQLAITDKLHIYIFNYQTNVFSKAIINFKPGYIEFKNGQFISVDLDRNTWRLSDFNNGLSWPDDAPYVGGFQTKPTQIMAAVSVPGKGNLLFVFGKNVIEPWIDVGLQLFPYQRINSFNINYGTLNAATIGVGDDIIAWLGVNEDSGPIILYSNGGAPQAISTDGIDFKLSDLEHPEDAYGFIFKQDGHTFYQLTFPSDNFSLTYDFETKKFFTLCDENMDYHIAKKVAFFDNNYFFVSFKDGNVYEMDADFETYDGKEIPRIRICKNIRTDDASPFVANALTFTIEQGQSSNVQRVDLSISRDGGETYGNIVGKILNKKGKRENRLMWTGLGRANDFVTQFRFWGKGRFVATDGIVSIYQ